MDVPLWQQRWWQATATGFLVMLLICGGFLPRMGTHSGGAPMPTDPDPRTLELGRPSDLPLPSRISVAQFEEKLFTFLSERKYVKLGWRRDKSVRDTGPYLEGRSFGTHPAVRVYYSPGVMRWLLNGRSGTIPDGEMIIKEQYPAPAIRHQATLESDLPYSLESWTVMVKDAAGSHDGWFWSNPAKGQRVVDNHRYPFADPISGFGLACIRCHAATQSPGAEPSHPANEFTFAALRNIEGFPGTPLTFKTDDSWRQGAKEEKTEVVANPVGQAPRREPSRPSAGFPSFFDAIKHVDRSQLSVLPPVTHDWVVSSREQGQEFLTSNQCMSCHAGLLAPFGPTMFVPTGASAEYGAKGWDVSPYGEWRWTPMGLAGRDPIVFAQIESEVKSLCKQFEAEPNRASKLCATLADTCMRCHGSMGKRQFAIDHPDASSFSVDHIHEVADPAAHLGHGNAKYGALARDGVGCVVCHRMQPRPQPASDHRPYLQYFLETSNTGNFHLGKKGEIYGPFKDDEIASYAMEHATGLKPKHNAFLKSSQLCASCHTVVLPNVDRPLDLANSSEHTDELTRGEVVPEFRKFHHHVEQATYLEWLNSEYENEINTQNPQAKSCQDCHMSRGLKDEKHGIDIAQLQTKIAVIQDTTYPEAENLVASDRLKVRSRETGFRRHNFSGLNAFLLEMFNQFDDVLGVPKADYMSGSTQGIDHAVEHMAQTARDDVASLVVAADWQRPNRLTARVVVANKVGHRFPSGVGFRRAFLELAIVETAKDPGEPERTVWASGLTNDQGVLLGADGQPLPTEFFDRDPGTGRQRFQQHHEIITSPDQVQVYETLLHDAKGEFTTSFVRSCETVKDNRLLPRGWRPEGPGPALTGRYLKATHPGPGASEDPRYQDGSGSDEVTYRIELPGSIDPARLQVRATLYYQAIPPYFLRNLFETAPDGPATRRLHHLTSQLNLKGTAIEDWKLRITAATCAVKAQP